MANEKMPVDLEENEPEVQAEKKGAKKERKKSDNTSEGKKKAPKDPKSKKDAAKKPAPVNGKKKKSGGGMFLLFFIVLLILAVAGGYVLIHYNISGARDKLIDMVSSLDPAYVTYQNRLVEQETKQKELDEREAAVLTEEQRLAELKTSLDKQEAELVDQQATKVPIYRQPTSDQDVEDMKSLAKIYANMEAATAATILASLYTTEDMAAILYFMAEKSAAPILAEMRTSLAADITDLLLKD